MRGPRTLLTLVLVVGAALLGAQPAAAGDNPLAGVRWGAWHPDTSDPGTDAPMAYLRRARGADRAAFRAIVDQPRARWFGAWFPPFDQPGRQGIYTAIRKYIDNVTGGDRRVGVQMAFFALQPFEQPACRTLPTVQQRADYLTWIDQAARAIGSTRTMVVLQPDMPFTLCLPGHSDIDLRLVDAAARRLAQLPNTTVYLDAGSADWLSPGQAARMLVLAGVSRARGFSLNLTHYSGNGHQIAYGQKVVRALARLGVPHRHFIVNSAQNGRPFIGYRHRAAFQHTPVCASPTARVCAALGHPPTTRTTQRGLDGLLWLGRPWLANTRVRSYREVLRLVRNSPYYRSALARRRHRAR